MIGYIITLLIVGLIAGFLARALVPGRQSMSIAATIVLGIVGSFVGGFIASLFRSGGDRFAFNPAGIIMSIVGAIVVLLIYVLATGRSGRSRI